VLPPVVCADSSVANGPGGLLLLLLQQ
jgi:hypothetical protein